MPDKKEIVLQKCKNAIDYGEPIMDYSFYYEVIALLKEQEAVVRCRDCKHRGTYGCPVYVGGDGMCSEPDDWFCSDGEQRG